MSYNSDIKDRIVEIVLPQNFQIPFSETIDKCLKLWKNFQKILKGLNKSVRIRKKVRENTIFLNFILFFQQNVEKTSKYHFQIDFYNFNLEN